MAEKIVEIAVPLLLPQQNQVDFIDHLQDCLRTHKGILKTHIHTDHEPADLCIHYDPNLVSLAAVNRLAQTAGSEIDHEYLHEEIPFSGLNTPIRPSPWKTSSIISQVCCMLPSVMPRA
jgi:Cd2+/Zn2+-exporting ATPase